MVQGSVGRLGTLAPVFTARPPSTNTHFEHQNQDLVRVQGAGGLRMPRTPEGVGTLALHGPHTERTSPPLSFMTSKQGGYRTDNLQKGGVIGPITSPYRATTRPNKTLINTKIRQTTVVGGVNFSPKREQHAYPYTLFAFHALLGIQSM